MDPSLERLVEISNKAAEKTKQLRESNRDFQAKAERVNPEQVRELVKDFSSRLEGVAGEIQEALEESVSLALKAGEPSKPPPEPFRAGDLAKHFRSLIDEIQAEARQPRAGEIATTLKSVDVEVKGLVVVEQNEARISTPVPGHPVDPGQLSTIRMSFGTIPVLPPPDDASSVPGPK